jgi:hypothetical protein
MSPKLAAETAVINKLIGVYRDEKDKGSKLEFFKKNNLLWMKNDVFGEAFEYSGNNTFHYPNVPEGISLTLHFEVMPRGGAKVTRTLVDEKGKQVSTAVKEKGMKNRDIKKG